MLHKINNEENPIVWNHLLNKYSKVIKISLLVGMILSATVLLSIGGFGVLSAMQISWLNSFNSPVWLTWTMLICGDLGVIEIGIFAIVLLCKNCCQTKRELSTERSAQELASKPIKILKTQEENDFPPLGNDQETAPQSENLKPIKVLKAQKGNDFSPLLISFYLGEGANNENVTIEQMWDYFRENKQDNLNTHHLIQWLFPIPTGSEGGYNPTAPYLNQEHIAAFQEESERGDRLRQHVHTSFLAMMTYFGLDYNEEKKTVSKRGIESDFEKSWNVLKRRWIPSTKNSHNHNFNRISRMLQFLKLIGMNIEAEAFYQFLQSLNNEPEGKCISSQSKKYWEEAMQTKNL